MLKEKYPYFLANEAQQPNTDLEVTDKYSGKVATRVALADAKAIDAGIAAAVKAQDACRKMPAYERQAVLEHCVKRFRERFDWKRTEVGTSSARHPREVLTARSAPRTRRGSPARCARTGPTGCRRR